jgi:hypothetical protein
LTVIPREDWDLYQYNRKTDIVYEKLLKPANFANVTAPYRENRAVMFESALFHQTDKFRFKKGYRYGRLILALFVWRDAKDRKGTR